MTASATFSASSLGDSLRQLAAAQPGRRQIIDHPPFERLVAYHAGQLAADDEALVREHLVSCAGCPALILELEDLRRAPAGAPSVAAHAADSTAAETTDAEFSPTPETRLWAARPLPPRMGTLVGVALLGCLAAGAALSGAATWERQAMQSAAVVQVTALSVVRGGDAERVAVRGQRFVLTFDDLPASSTPEVQIEVLDGHGRTLWARRAAASSPPQSVAIEMSRQFLPAGTYSFVISEVTGVKTGNLLRRYDVDLAYS